jgi:Photosynthetic reaction centre cytochrome C subunit
MQQPQERPKNLKILPDDISSNDLRKIMRQYSGELGVECEFCHTARDPITHRSDRASDANPTKDTARYMMQMTDDLNSKYLAEMPSRQFDEPITCGTCHRGVKHPSIFVPPPRQEGGQPGGGPPREGGNGPAGTPPAAAPQAK